MDDSKLINWEEFKRKHKRRLMMGLFMSLIHATLTCFALVCFFDFFAFCCKSAPKTSLFPPDYWAAAFFAAVIEVAVWGFWPKY